jgi:two-component system KDP operon response regulator KdpE
MTMNILVIDDEPPIRKLLRMGLATQGYEIFEAPDARTALDVLSRETVDLTILDLGLPDMRGHDLLRLIRMDFRDLPVVVLSSRDDEAGKVEALDLGADDYVTKPFGTNSRSRASEPCSRSTASASTWCAASSGSAAPR